MGADGRAWTRDVRASWSELDALHSSAAGLARANGANPIAVLRCATMACLRWFALVTPFATAALAFAAPLSASAAGEACYRDTECVGAELCIEGVCAASEVQACTTTDDCTNDDAECADGYCKVEGVTCQNPAGACWVVDGGGRCECGNGDGSGWSDGFNPDDPPDPQTDDDLLATCQANLVDSCGEDPPALPDTCTGQVLEDCQALIDREDAFFQACGEDVSPIDIARVGRCCDDYDDPMYAAYRECTMALQADSCPGDAWSECEGPTDGTPAGEGQDNGGETDGDADQDGDDVADRGCAIATPDGERSGWLAGLALLTAFGATRRRRSAVGTNARDE